MKRYTRKYIDKANEKIFLTPDEEVELFIKYKSGDMKAFNELVETSMVDVYIIAKEVWLKNRSVDIDDLISEGNIGLIRAIQGFDHTRGFRLYTYASSTIRRSMITYIYSLTNVVRYPMNQMKLESVLELTDYDSFEEVDIFEGEDKVQFYNKLKNLKPKHLDLLNNLYGLNGHTEMSVSDYAKSLGVTKQNISAKRLAILNKIREDKILE